MVANSDMRAPEPIGEGVPSVHLNPKQQQTPIAVIGIANRLPGNSNNPSQLWNLLLKGGIAGNEPPKSRFSLSGHYDGSLKPHTIRTPGAMFLENIDPAEFDASFFNINRADAIAMDPQQRQLLEVVYEAMENAGLSLEKVKGAPLGCFVGSYAVDYQDMQFRDPEDRATGITVGAGRAILSNRISHFFDLKGPSMTIDTACSASMVGVDVACRYVQTGQAEGAIVAGANLYMSPDQNQDMGAMRVTSSATGRCHTFDAKADGYCKAEAINVVILKRLDAALRDRDPIRAVIRGTSTNSDGWTPGIASPSPEAQAVAIRAAYAAAGIDNFNETGYLECHGTGTLAGDPIEVTAAASVFGPSRPADKPLIIGSIKSNIGHSEPGAGVSGLIKAVLAVERGIIPGNPTFIDPNPKIDFKGLKVRATRVAVPWPKELPSRIASINSFGYGGSNAHAVIQDAESFLRGQKFRSYVSSFVAAEDDIDFFADEEVATRPKVLLFSANEEQSLKTYAQTLKKHLVNPNTNINLSDLAYTLSERRSRLFHRGFLVTKTASVDEGAIVYGKKGTSAPTIGFVFTGQGAQWPQMGKNLVSLFPSTRQFLKRLDRALQSLPTPPKWSLLDELVESRAADHLRQPEFSQPLVTALQLSILQILNDWGIHAAAVVGHSSGEIAAASAAGYLTPEEAIRVAFYRGQAAKDLEGQYEDNLSMMAVGLGPEQVSAYIQDPINAVQIACYNSPNSVTLSGRIPDLELVRARLQADGHFARLLQVNLAYHSKYMSKIGDHYEQLLAPYISSVGNSLKATMYSSVTGVPLARPTHASYWKDNMVSPVRFNQACHGLLTGPEGVDFLIELGPSGALAGPIGQIRKSPDVATNTQYYATTKRGADSSLPLFDIAGYLFNAGGSVDFKAVNRDESATEPPFQIIDLPNYAWNHATKYWHESDASKDWRFRPFVHHDLLGSKILGTPWHAPTFKKGLDLKDVPWLKDHKMGSDIIFPASGYIAMAMEALYQSRQMTNPIDGIDSVDQLGYHLRNIRYDKALVLEEDVEAKVFLNLSPHPGTTKDSWYDFKISSVLDGAKSEHCVGLIRLDQTTDRVASKSDLNPLQYPSLGSLWYKAQLSIGYGFGPNFQKVESVESCSGFRESRAIVGLSEPASAWSIQSKYPMHPASIDGCFQTVTPSLVAGERTNINTVLVPAGVDSLVIKPARNRPEKGVSVAVSEYTGRGRREETKNYMSSCSVYHPETGALLLELTNLRYHKLDTGNTGEVKHTYSAASWNPDVTLLTNEQFLGLESGDRSRVQHIIDLVAHKKPTLKVVEVNTERGDKSALWLEGSSVLREASEQYTLVSSDPATLLEIEGTYESGANVAFTLLDIAGPQTSALPWTEVDLVIVKRRLFTGDSVSSITQKIKQVLSQTASVLFVEQGLDVDGIPPAESLNGSTDFHQAEFRDNLIASGLGEVREIEDDSLLSAFLITTSPFTAKDSLVSRGKKLAIATISTKASVNPVVLGHLEAAGWSVSLHSYPFADVPPKSLVLVVDELQAPLLSTVTEGQWASVKTITGVGAKVLWLTVGSQLDVTNPNAALVHGLFRTVRAEDRGVKLTTLDLEASDSANSLDAILRVLGSLEGPSPKTLADHEYVERGGLIYVNRILPDLPVNQFSDDEKVGVQPVEKSLHDIEPVAMLRAEKLGTLDALVYSEITEKEVPVKPNNVEVEIFAAGLNFKDVAVTMGIVPENEYLLGLEGAGIVRRVGAGATDYKVGDRVAVLRNGTFANRIQVPVERTHRIPDSLTFEDATTIPLVYLTALYSLFDIANLQRGQSVLIHSAAGGVGIACIQLAQYVGAEIYVTVGTEDKRKFLADTYHIPENRMYSSRTKAFAAEIREATGGRGIDVIVNSLTGDLLDESWRLTADGGTMIEIGKRDIIDRNWLSMEPFDRNCSFRAVDVSYKQVTDPMIQTILKRVFKLVDGGHIGPIRPIKTFPFDDIPAAFAFMRGGRHIGKIVVTNGTSQDVRVPVRPALQKLNLRDDVSYLIVGGLKGLCGSLAVHLAQNGARHIISLSRSGYSDGRSQAYVRACKAFGAQIYEAKADVADFRSVRRVFLEATRPIAGVIQGAMVLRDKPFETMTLEDYHTTISSKVLGTWNLHNAALEQGVSLDFFTMLSSISGIIGQKGQANYAAANVFMDAFARYRKSLNLVANSVDLGVIEDVGYVAEQGGMESHFDKRQWTGINETLLRRILTTSILQQQTTTPLNEKSSDQLITGIAVPLPQDSELVYDARFAGLFRTDGGAGNKSGKKSGGDAGKDIQAFLLLHGSGAAVSALVGPAVEILNKQFVKTLRLSEPMEPAKPLATYGLDSLSAVEFRNWVRAELGAEITLLEVTNSPSLIALCERIIAKIPLPS